MSAPGKLILLGGGGHAKVVAETAAALGWELAGILDPGRGKGSVVAGMTVLGTGLDLGEDPAWLRDCAFFPAIGNGEARWREYGRLRAAGARVPSLVHPRAVLSPSASVGAGSVVMAGAIVQAAGRIGEAVIVNTGAQIDHDCRIGDGVMIAPGAILCGGVEIDDHAFVAAGVVIVPGVKIGRNAFIGAGTVVVDSLPGGALLKAIRRASSIPSGS